VEELFIPATGMAMEDAVLLEWLYQPGDAVVAGEPVAVIETDKATIDVAASSDGVLGAHLAEAGSRVKIGAPIVRVLAPGETEPAGPGETAPPAHPAAVPATASPAGASHAGEPPATASPAGTEPAGAGFRRPHTLTPRQRRALREQAGEVFSPAAPPAAGATSAAGPQAAGESPALSRAQRASAQVAKAVSQSWSTVPHFAASREIDMTDLLHYLEGVRRTEPAVSITDLLLQATARAWRAIRPGGRDGVGMSVATDQRVINVSVPGAADQPLPELARQRRQAVDRARRGVLSPVDFTPVDITVSNLGTHGVDWFTGVIPLDQVALLTIGRIRSGLEVSPAAVRIRQLMWVTANLDHRHLDGADGAALLAAFSAACSVSPGRPAGHDVLMNGKDQ
jgi:pyruvate dehydrogenase E2 component (dihydrolipoamide acetyltransferase)